MENFFSTEKCVFALSPCFKLKAKDKMARLSVQSAKFLVRDGGDADHAVRMVLTAFTKVPIIRGEEDGSGPGEECSALTVLVNRLWRNGIRKGPDPSQYTDRLKAIVWLLHEWDTLAQVQDAAKVDAFIVEFDSYLKRMFDKILQLYQIPITRRRPSRIKLSKIKLRSLAFIAVLEIEEVVEKWEILMGSGKRCSLAKADFVRAKQMLLGEDPCKVEEVEVKTEGDLKRMDMSE